VRAGDLRHWLLIESKTVAVDSNGDRTETWATFAECWGHIRSGSGREFFGAKQTITDLSHDVLIRYVAGVTTDMRIKYVDPKNGNAERYFNIRAVNNPDELDEMLRLQCSEVII